MATVYKAHDATLDRTVALKVLPPEFLYDPSFAKRFAREARVVARLEHPNIVPIYASGIDDGIPWMSMRLLGGGNLGTLLEHRRPGADEAVRILRSVADALDYAHARGVVHRDIKPTNILLDDSDRVCLGDFGLAQMLEGEQGVTRTGTLIGTPHYMAPEQALGQPADHRCDIYSLGIVAYEMFVGAPPFTGDSPVAVLLKHVNQPLPPSSGSRVSRPVVDTIQKAVAKAPAERWSSAGTFVKALEVAAGLAVMAAGGEGAPPAPQRAAGVSFSRAAAAVATVAVTFAALWWMTQEPPSREQPPEPIRLTRSWHPGAAVPFPAPIAPQPGMRNEIARPPITVSRPGVESTPAAPERSAPPLGTTTIKPSVEVPLPSAPAPAPAPARASAPPPAAAPERAPGSEGVPAAAATADTRAAGERSPDSVQPAVKGPDVVTPPIRIREVSPTYPAAARAAQLEGDVLLDAVVGADGKVAEVSVLRSVHTLLDEAAKSAVRQYQYTPGRRNGTPESARVRITVSFKLR